VINSPQSARAEYGLRKDRDRLFLVAPKNQQQKYLTRRISPEFQYYRRDGSLLASYAEQLAKRPVEKTDQKAIRKQSESHQKINEFGGGELGQGEVHSRSKTHQKPISHPSETHQKIKDFKAVESFGRDRTPSPL
jgi:hypothetical protein